MICVILLCRDSNNLKKLVIFVGKIRILQYFQHTHKSLLQSSKLTLERELLKHIDWSQRLICIKGFRGVGKTTFILDHIKQKYLNDQDVLYINLNNFYFTKRKIFSFADEFSKLGGKVLFFDQIQKYPTWSEELRKCYEEIPDLKIIFTSSPVLRVAEGNPDLQGIVNIYHLDGLSFREYLNHKTNKNFKVASFEEIIKNHVSLATEITSSVKPLAYFSEYLKSGYYPYFIDSPNFYMNSLLKHINLALEIDVPYLNQVEVKYLSKLRKLLHIIAAETPLVPNVSKLANEIETSRATVMNYLRYLKNAKLINLLYNNGDEDQLKKPDRIFLHNSNLQHAIAPQNVENYNLRSTFFFNQVGSLHHISSAMNADFLVNDTYKFIAGGRKIEASKELYAASDMIEVGEGNKIPLWLFGFLY